jgi:hypothetical protein
MPPTTELSAETLASIRERVASGAKFLDQKVPDWYHADINWYRFNIDSAIYCMLGQLNGCGVVGAAGRDGDYWAACEALDLHNYTLRCGYGFTGALAGERDEFKNAWYDEVNKRLVSAGLFSSEPETATEPKLPTITLNPTEQELLIELLTAKLEDVEAERMKLKEQYRQLLNPTVLSTRALLAAVRDAS